MRISDWSSDVCSSDLPDRIVVGTTSERAQEVMAQLYRPLHLNRSPLLFTARRTAELIKYAANAFLAVKITFINEIADLCEQVGANEIGRAHVGTPVTNAQLVCRLLHDKKQDPATIFNN